MLNHQLSKSNLLKPISILLVLGALLAGAAELPQGGWIQIPLLSLVWRQLDCYKSEPVKRFLLLSFTFGVGYFVIALWWLYISLHDVGGMNALLSSSAVFLLSCYVAIYFSVAPLSLRSFKNSPYIGLFLASSWVLSEYLRGEIFTGFPWMGLAEAQVNGPFNPIAPYLGGLGCTFLTVYTSWELFQLKDRALFLKRIRSLAIISAVVFLSSLWSFTQPTGSPITVELIQGNFAQSLIFKPEGIQQQILFYEKSMLQADAQLIVSPETAFPWPETNLHPNIFEALQNFSNQTGSNLLFGVIGRDPASKDGREYSNRAIGLSPEVQRYQYDKNHLVPFGEFIPPGFRWFVNAFSVPLSDFARGGDQQPNYRIIRKNHSPIYAAITLCYEDVFGGELASRIRNNSEPTNLLINLTNLAWFGQSQAPTQQLRLSQLRSLETGLPALRATNTGITSTLGPDGKLLQSLPEFTQTSLKTQIQAFSGKTPFVVWGNLPILSISCLLLTWGFIRYRRF